MTDRAHEFEAYLRCGFSFVEVSEFFECSIGEIVVVLRDYYGETIH